jgi:predicted metal-dependent peptidase
MQKINAAVRDQLIKARISLTLNQPFYGILALRLEMREDRSIPTLCVNYRTIYYNPDFVAGLTPELTRAAVAHEVLHPMMDHINRRQSRNPGKWNAASDFVVNAILIDSGFPIGEGWLHNPQYEGMSAEHIYELLPDQEGGGGGSVLSYGALDDQDSEGQPMTADEAAMAELDWKVATVYAAKKAQEAGKLPASLARYVEAVKGNKVDWREQLRRFITTQAKNDYSWMRPQRRMVPWGHFLPSLYSEALEALVAVIDTSGSIDQATLNAFGAEILAAKDISKPEKLVVMYCDAKVAHVDEYTSFEPVEFQMHGGGGTDFRPPFERLTTMDVRPNCLVYLTDGYGPFPESPPDYPVLWVCTTDVVAPWGTTIRIEV